jgi:hypothetical protein
MFSLQSALLVSVVVCIVGLPRGNDRDGGRIGLASTDQLGKYLRVGQFLFYWIVANTIVTTTTKATAAAATTTAMVLLPALHRVKVLQVKAMSGLAIHRHQKQQQQQNKSMNRNR